MNENEELLEKEIPGEENPEAEATENVDVKADDVDVETGTTENGEEAAVEDKPTDGEPVEEEVESEVSEEPESEMEPEMEPEESEMEPEMEPEQEKMLTQSQVNELVGKARQEGRLAAMKELYGRYGVNDDNEMNDIFGKGQGYDLLNDEYNTLNGNFKNVSAENALLKSNVVQNRWDDVKAILGSKGMDITVENIQSELMTHPEWQNSGTLVENGESKELSPESLEKMGNATKPVKQTPTQPSTIRKLGSDIPDNNVDLEQEKVLKMFGM